MCRRLQPCSTSSAASQSSSSGCVGRAPLAPKSLGVATSPVAEVMLPQPVDDHPRRQRIGRIDDPLGQRQPPPLVVGRVGCAHLLSVAVESVGGFWWAEPTLPNATAIVRSAPALPPRGCIGSPRWSRFVARGAGGKHARIEHRLSRQLRQFRLRSFAARRPGGFGARLARRAGRSVERGGWLVPRPRTAADRGTWRDRACPIVASRRSSATAIVYSSASRSRYFSSRSRPQRTASIVTTSGNSSSTQPPPISLEIQLRPLPSCPSLMCSSR